MRACATVCRPTWFPAYLEQLAVLPVLPSGKADRNSLPPPRGERRLAARGEYAAPAAGAEQGLAELLASVLRIERVSADSHFFNDLGADSLLMAHFNAAIRQRGDLPPVSMKDIYLHPTIRQLAAALPATSPAQGPVEGPAQPVDGQAQNPVWAGEHSARPAEPDARPAGTPQYLLCGALQLLAFAGYVCLAALWLNMSIGWVATAHGMPQIYAHLAAVGGGGLLATGGVPVAVKWLLIGRWKRQRVRVWSLAYVRFWVVKGLVVTNPLVRLCVGTPLYNLYLWALGAKVGRGALILTPHVPVCTDLLSIGPGSVIRKDCYLNGYRAQAGFIETGPVTAGAGAFLFNGTPLKGLSWRLLGVRIGRRVFDDGCDIVERTLASVGSDCALNAGSTIQSHSLEDGTFKSDHFSIGAGCTIGTHAFVHYGVTMGDGAVVDTDSFVMKGECIPPRARWQGNPAAAMPDDDGSRRPASRSSGDA